MPRRGEERQVVLRRSVEWRNTADDRGAVADEPAANCLRNSIGGENDAALTAVVMPPLGGSRHGRRVTPAGVFVGAPEAGRAAGAFAASVRSRATTRSVMSRFLSAETMNEACGSLLRIMA